VNYQFVGYTFKPAHHGVAWVGDTLRANAIADAIRAGEIEGDVYSDGEVWADPQSLTRYLAEQIPT
jgi:glycine/D-amino acid oxidase-like deaminating enzyme